jgi:hypothetical protein
MDEITAHRVTQSGSGLTRHDIHGPIIPLEDEHDPRALRRVLFGLVAFWALIGWWVLL